MSVYIASEGKGKFFFRGVTNLLSNGCINGSLKIARVISGRIDDRCEGGVYYGVFL